MNALKTTVPVRGLPAVPGTVTSAVMTISLPACSSVATLRNVIVPLSKSLMIGFPVSARAVDGAAVSATPAASAVNVDSAAREEVNLCLAVMVGSLLVIDHATLQAPCQGD